MKTALSYLDHRDRARLQICVAACSTCGAHRGQPCKGSSGKSWVGGQTHIERRNVVKQFKRNHLQTYLKLASQLLAQHLDCPMEEETRI